jgi:acyl dehydratase
MGLLSGLSLHANAARATLTQLDVVCLDPMEVLAAGRRIELLDGSDNPEVGGSKRMIIGLVALVVGVLGGIFVHPLFFLLVILALIVFVRHRRRARAAA